MFISNAYAQAAAGAQDPSGGIMSFLPMVLILVFMYFFLFRPQQKRTKEHRAMLEALAKGDEVSTQGGIVGKIIQVGDSFVQLEVSENSRITVQKSAIVSVLPKGTLKAL